MKKTLATTTSIAVIALAAQGFAQDTLTPQTSEIEGQYGQIDAFYSNIDAFWGDIDAFWGDIDAFWGDIDAFWGDIDAFTGDIDAFWGDIDAFWSNIDAFWGDIDAFTSGGQYDQAATSLNQLFDDARTTFGVQYEKNSGKTFDDGFKKKLLNEFGLDLKDPDTLQNLTGRERARFFIAFYDNLMAYSGVDVVDHWMPAINWSPKISQSAGGGAGVTVGLLDTPITNPNLVGGRVASTGGFGLSRYDHGAGVASILAGAHDGQGVMGVAPNASFLVFNPFDESFTATWDKVRTGIAELTYMSDASIINMSLGVEGYVLHPDWARVLNDFGAGLGTLDTVLVKSAGNSGVSQTRDVNLFLSNAVQSLILVGSVGLDGEISDFSNRPGTACITNFGLCREGGRLMDRFIVAPGEGILVQDNAGNVMRVSGTSLAAPQVSGAAALIQSKWEWLRDRPVETADILLESATDLGAPGTDEVYGRGLLNVEAALQPLDQSTLYVTVNGNRRDIFDSGMTRSLLGLADDAITVTALEDIGSTYRDFDVEVATLDLQTTEPAFAAETEAQEQLAQATTNASSWWSSINASSGKKGRGRKRIASVSFAPQTVAEFGTSGTSDWALGITAQPRDPMIAVADDALPFQTGMRLRHRETGLEFTAGQGDGRHALTGGENFVRPGIMGNRENGANPFLGFASGGSYAGASMRLNGRTRVSFGMTSQEDEHLVAEQNSGELVSRFDGREDYQAQALTTAVDLAPTDRLSLSARYTSLEEQTGLFGGQGTGVLNLDRGTQTEAVTLDMRADLTPRTRLSLSGSLAQTMGNGQANSLLSVDEEGLTASAMELAVDRLGVFSKNDAMRIAISQPLHVNNGSLTLTETQVVDRSAGTLGLVEETITLGGDGPRHVAEVLYGRPLADGKASLTAFGQYRTQTLTTDQNEVVGGVNLSLRF